jgi:hypothetical protein
MRVATLARVSPPTLVNFELVQILMRIDESLSRLTDNVLNPLQFKCYCNLQCGKSHATLVLV